MGVWIETEAQQVLNKYLDVTPCVGVWIETSVILSIAVDEVSHPAWVCGLKLAMVALCLYLKKVTPCVGVWIETQERYG